MEDSGIWVEIFAMHKKSGFFFFLDIKTLEKSGEMSLAPCKNALSPMAAKRQKNIFACTSLGNPINLQLYI